MTQVVENQDIQQALESEGTTLYLYNPGDTVITDSYAANEYNLIPVGEYFDRKANKTKQGDGMNPIRDQWGWEWQQDGDGAMKRRTDQRKLVYSAGDAVRHLVKHLSACGVVWLQGPESTWPKQKEDARKKWITWKVAQMNAVVAGRNGYLREFHSNPANAGRIPEPPSQAQTAAIEWLDAYRAGLVETDKYKCIHDGYRTNDDAKWEIHNSVNHPGNTASVDSPAVPRKPGRPRKVVEES